MLSINRSGLYYEPTESNDDEIANMIHDIWLEAPVYGYRKITKELLARGYAVSQKKVLRIMREANIQALYPKPRLSNANKQNKKYPYLLNDIKITRPNQVWATDITYIKIPGGYIYLMAIIDWFSRFVITWQISNTMGTEFCLGVLEEAFKTGAPEILNTDQGSQFTSEAWIAAVEAKSVLISMDGIRRWADNIIIERFWRTLKYEGVFIHKPSTIHESRKVVREFIAWYNYKRRHQSLNYVVPNEVYKQIIMPPAGLH